MLRDTIIVKHYLKEDYSDLETVIMLWGYKTFYMLNSTKHELSAAHEN